MKNKKLFAILTLVCFMFTLMPVAAMAEDEIQANSQNTLFNGNANTDSSSPSALALRSTGETELVIKTVADLQTFATAVNNGDNFAGKVVKLGADINLTGIEWAPIGGDSVYFAGEFDGQGYTISNLTQTTGARMGLFGLVEKAYLHDLTLKNVIFNVNDNDARVGAIAGNLQYWNVIEDVIIDGINITVNGNDGLIGAVAGYVWKSQMGNVDVKNAVFTVNGTGNVIGGNTGYGRAHIWDTDVTGNNTHWLDGTVQTIDGTEHVLQNYWEDCDVNNLTINLNGNGNEAGGFFGSDTYNSHSNFFVDCHVTDLTVICAEGTSQNVGGFIAWNNGTTSAGTVKGFDGCSASGTIKGANGTYGGFAGQVGGRACEYVNASADVDITSTGTAGGFVGITQAYSTHKYTFTNCVATSDVSGTVAGGFAGKNGLGGDGKSVYVDYDSCTASGIVNGTNIAGGFLGEVNTELPSTNWNIVDSIGDLNMLNCIASANVSGDENNKVGGLIGYLDTVANGDAKEGNNVDVDLTGSTYTVVPPYNKSDDSIHDNENENGAKFIEASTEKVIKILPNAITLDEKDVVNLNISASFEGYTVKSWNTTNNSVVTVNENGTVTAVGGGDAEITVTVIFENEEYVATCEVTVTKAVTPVPPSGSSSGGGFSGKYNYPVNIADVDGATVTSSENYAVAGETVTITVDPDAGKQVDEVIVTDADGDVITVNKVGDNKYTFTMPAGKVNVAVTTEAADYDLRIVMQINNKNILVNNRTFTNDVAPVIVGDRTMVPIRVVTETLGGTADWNANTQTVTLKIDGKVLTMTIGKVIPGIGVAPVIMNDRTYVPIRYVAEKLGANVEWIAQTQQIIIEQ